MEANGQRIKAWIDGNLVIDYLGSMVSPNPGRIGLGGWTGICGNLAARFDDVIVTIAGAGMTATPASIPADSTSTAAVMLSNAPITHQIHFLSSLAGSVFSSPEGAVNANGQLTTIISSTIPGTAIITAQDLTTGETFPASASVTFTPVGGGTQPPPGNIRPIAITDIRADYPLDGAYLKGIDLHNRIQATINWQGTTPGRVDFNLNGQRFSENTAGATTSHAFNLGSDLQTGDNQLQITAYNAAGVASETRSYMIRSVSTPGWIDPRRRVGPHDCLSGTPAR